MDLDVDRFDFVQGDVVDNLVGRCRSRSKDFELIPRQGARRITIEQREQIVKVRLGWNFIDGSPRCLVINKLRGTSEKMNVLVLRQLFKVLEFGRPWVKLYNC